MPEDFADQLTIHHNVEAQRFETFVDGELCRADYRLMGAVMAFHHTEVPPRLEGRGIASRLVATAIDYARQHGLRIAPHCSYVQAYMRNHPETHDVLA